MDWANERYVRVYTRDTGDWAMWPWETRALLLFIFRKLDRSGVLQLGKGRLRALAAIVGMPEAELAIAIEPLIEDGCVQIREDKLVVPNFMKAQETPQSDKQRKQQSRERSRDDAMGHEERRAVTPSHAVESELVTRGHARSQSVTPCLAVPSLAVPCRESDAREARREPESGVIRKSEPPPVNDASVAETGIDLARRLWVELWRAHYRRDYDFSPRTGPGSEDYVLQRVGESATIRGAGAEAYLRHKFGEYLKDKGHKSFLVEKKHPLKNLEHDWATYGEPKPPGRLVPRDLTPKPEEAPPVSTDEQRFRAEAAMQAHAGGLKSSTGGRT